MPTFEEKILILATPRRVFDSLADLERAVAWMPGLLSATRTSRKRSGAGVTVALRARVAGREVEGIGRCLEWSRPTRLVFESSFDPGVTAVSTFECSANGDGTELTARLEYTMRGSAVGRFVGGLVGGQLARRDVRKALEALKTQVESSVDGPARRGGG